MRMKYTKSILSALLVISLLLAGCTAIPHSTKPSIQTVTHAATETESTTAIATETTPAAAVRYPIKWAQDAVIYEVNVRQYSEEGTFDAFAQNLQTLKDMGINTLWFMPIHPISETRRSGTLGSYYSITDYREINPEFGTKEDFKHLVDQAHEMGFKVMLDWVANHTGWDCPWIQAHPDWYTHDKNGNITDPVGMGWPDVADLNYASMDMQQEMISCMKYWVEEFDIDGFRCDYAGGVPTDFWETARAELEQVKPLLMLAEDNSTPQLLKYAFDMNYNWKLYDVLRSVALGTKRANTIQFALPQNYPDGTYCLNFLNNHDKNSWERTIEDAFPGDRLAAMFALIYTLPGTPLVYTGDEIGLDHKIAFMEKDAVDWSSTDISYRELLAQLSAIRSQNSALYSGNYGGDFEYIDLGNPCVFAFTRTTDDNTVKCVLNLFNEEVTVNTSPLLNGSETVLLHGCGADLLDTGSHALSEISLTGEVTLNPWEFWIIAE